MSFRWTSGIGRSLGGICASAYPPTFFAESSAKPCGNHAKPAREIWLPPDAARHRIQTTIRTFGGRPLTVYPSRHSVQHRPETTGPNFDGERANQWHRLVIMKTTTFLLATAVAAPAAVLAGVSAPIAFGITAVLGLSSIALSDYGNAYRRLEVAPVTAKGRERHPLAA